jgi:hypothetical protein
MINTPSGAMQAFLPVNSTLMQIPPHKNKIVQHTDIHFFFFSSNPACFRGKFFVEYG